MHHIHVLNRTEAKENITFEEFYEIVTKKNYWLIFIIYFIYIYMKSKQKLNFLYIFIYFLWNKIYLEKKKLYNIYVL